jgi:hypothetical protein
MLVTLKTVRFLNKGSACRREKRKKKIGVDFGVGISCKAACLEEKQP